MTSEKALDHRENMMLLPETKIRIEFGTFRLKRHYPKRYLNIENHKRSLNPFRKFERYYFTHTYTNEWHGVMFKINYQT